MKTIETERLTLRKYKISDFAAVHSYASSEDNLIYIPREPNSEEQTREFIKMAIADADETPCLDYQFAIVMKDADKQIGGGNLTISGAEAEIGYMLHRDYWKQGYGTEVGKALLMFGFEELKLHRIIAHCDAENIGSYRIMEKIGMRREGLFIESRPPHKMSDKKYGDGLFYAILQDEVSRFVDKNTEIFHYIHILTQEKRGASPLLVGPGSCDQPQQLTEAIA